MLASGCQTVLRVQRSTNDGGPLPNPTKSPSHDRKSSADDNIVEQLDGQWFPCLITQLHGFRWLQTELLP